MQGRFNIASAGRHYRQLDLASRVETASPHALVALLYEELLGAIDTMILSARNGAALAGANSTIKARSILVALEASLDFENGGELAAALAKVYRAAGREINQAVQDDDDDKLTALRAALSDIVYAWTALSVV